MSDPDELAPPPRERSWTRLEDYLDPIWFWRRSARRNRRMLQPRTEPEAPRFSLGMLPFLVMMAAMAVLAVMIISAAIPGKRMAPRQASGEPEVGRAAPGWLGNR